MTNPDAQNAIHQLEVARRELVAWERKATGAQSVVRAIQRRISRTGEAALGGRVVTDTITVRIKEVVAKKHGETKGRAWTLFKVGTTNANGQPSLTFTTFEASWQNLIGKLVETSYEVKVNGDFKDYHLSDVKDAKVLDEGNGHAPQPVQGELGFSAEDRSSLSEILYLLKDLRAKFS